MGGEVDGRENGGKCVAYPRYGHTGAGNIPDMATQKREIFLIWPHRGGEYSRYDHTGMGNVLNLATQG